MTKIIQKFINYVNNNHLGDINTNTSFKNLTTLKIGGHIACLYLPKSLDDLVVAYRYLLQNKIPYLVIGKGSNILASDRDFMMVVISLKKLTKIIKLTTNLFLVESGISCFKLANFMVNNGYKVEFLSVIPGSLGGAIYMNAGAYQEEIANIIKEVTYLDESGKLITLFNHDLNFSYRYSIFKEKKGLIVSALIRVDLSNEPHLLKENVLKMWEIKKQTQPLKMLSAGSTFKNGKDYKAWELIADVGYRGYQYNDALVSKMHTNYLINKGKASFLDMITLIKMIQKDVKEKYKIDLECEWEIID